MADEGQVVSRVANYPLVSDSLAKLTKVYQETKDRSTLIRLGCSVAETGIQAAVHVARPILKKLDTPAVNSLACQQLDKFETAFPVITKPTDVVLDEAKALLTKAVQPTVDCVKEKVNNVREFEEKMVGGIRSYTTAAVDGAKNYGLASINGLASAAGLNRVLDAAEFALDRYLPLTEAADGAAEASRHDDDAVAEDDDDDDDDDDPSEPAEKQLQPLERVRIVSQKVKQRAYDRAMVRLRRLQLRSTETLKKLNFTVDLIEYAKQNLDSTAERVQHKAAEVRSKVLSMYEQLGHEQAEDHDATSNEGAAQPDAVEKKVLYAARSVASRAQLVMRQVATFARLLPSSALNQIKEMEQLAENLYLNVAKASGFGDVSFSLLQSVKAKAQGVLNFSHQLTEMVLSNAPSILNLEKAVDWMVLDIDLDGLEIGSPELCYQWRIDDVNLPVSQRLANGSVPTPQE